MRLRRYFVLIFIQYLAIFSCTSLSNSKWTRTNVAELNCKGLENFFDQDVHDECRKVSAGHKMYNVMSTMYNLQMKSKLCRGKEMRSMKDLKKACPHVVYGSIGSAKSKHSIFGCKSNLNGFPNSQNRYKFNGPTLNHSGKLACIWTDSKRYILSIVCAEKSLYFTLMSTKPGLDKRTKKLVLRKITQIGFDLNNVIVIPHGEC